MIILELTYEERHVEVKGVRLIIEGEARFSDASIERETKHLKELIKLKKEGIRTVLFFLIQHPKGDSFRPNWEMIQNSQKH